MNVRRVRTEDAPMRRYVEEGWIPYQEELSEAVPTHSLADFSVDEAVEYFLEEFETPARRLWVLLTDDASSTGRITAPQTDIQGFVATTYRPAPDYLDWPATLRIDDLWVHEDNRGVGLADDLVARALQQAQEDGCPELAVNVAVGNDRAVSYFDQLGFETDGYRLYVPRQDVTAKTTTDETAIDPGPELRFRRLTIDEDAIDRFFGECWRPFWEDLGEAVGETHLHPSLDRDTMVEELLDSYDVPDRRCWIALTDVEDRTADLDEIDAEFAGWINAGLEPTDRFLDPPDRLFIGNLYVKPAYRGSGLADQLMRRALQYAREEGCVELSLGTDVANERARAYYAKLGFEPLRQQLTAPVSAVAAELET